MSGQAAWKSSVTTVSSTLSDLGVTSDFGKVRYGENGKRYMLAKAGASIAVALCVEITGITASEYLADLVETANVGIFGANTTGSALVSGNYFWCQVGGPASVKNGAATTAGKALQVDATGELIDFVPGTGTPVALNLVIGADGVASAVILLG